MNGARRLRRVAPVIATPFAMTAALGIAVGAAVGAAVIALPAAANGASDHTVGRWAYKRLSRAQEHLSEDRFKEAAEALDQMRQRERLNAHERALMWQTLGYLHAAQEHYGAAAEAFERCLADPNALPNAVALGTRYSLGHSYLAAGRFAEAVHALQQWFDQADNPSPQAHHLMAMACAQNREYKRALDHARRAIRAVSQPPESWLQLVLALHLETDDAAGALAVIKRLLHRFPKKNYWMQLAAIYGELDDDARVLAVMELMYEQGLLTTPRQIQNLARLYVQRGIPLEAARVLRGAPAREGEAAPDTETAMLLATSLLHAREIDAAIAPLEKAAAGSEDGKLYVQLAQVHLGQDAWTAAAAAARNGLTKGGLDDVGAAYLLLGMAEHGADRPSKARMAFAAAQEYEGSREAAAQWLKLVMQ